MRFHRTAVTAFTASAARPFDKKLLTVFDREYPFGWLGFSLSAKPVDRRN